MTIFLTRTTNSTFAVADEGVEHASLDAAYAASIESAVQIGADEIRAGAAVAMMHVCIESQEGKTLARGIVSLSTSRLTDE